MIKKLYFKQHYIDCLSLVNFCTLLWNLLKNFLLFSEEMLNFCPIFFSKSDGRRPCSSFKLYVLATASKIWNGYLNVFFKYHFNNLLLIWRNCLSSIPIFRSAPTLEGVLVFLCSSRKKFEYSLGIRANTKLHISPFFFLSSKSRDSLIGKES